ncbi:MAG: flagellar hook-length control protein FliK [Candidatus Competibacter sp.]|nr:flagellar hook-length control protein FliK [Candidatus Competibacter sp.]MDG4607145.1 flagellar hook-length control protein FliK [Candidatus Contendobacter sp.]HRD48358.1 flagellar hook-length control protein FliK [Candidatus Contendobacter sp.]
MSYLELPPLFAAAANTAGNTAGVATTLGVVVETDGQAAAQLPSFSQLLQGGVAERAETGADAVALIAGQAVDDGAGLWKAGKVRLPTAEHAAVDSTMMTQVGADPQIAALALTFGTVTPAVGKSEAGSRERAITERDSDPDALDAERTETVWPGLALFMDSRSALQGANATKLESSAQSMTTGADAAGEVIRARNGAGPTLAPVLAAGDPLRSGAAVVDTVERALTDSPASPVTSADAVVGVTDEGGHFKSLLANLTTGALPGDRRTLPNSPVVNAPSPLPADSPESVPVVEAASPSLGSPARFATQDAARSMIPPVDRSRVDWSNVASIKVITPIEVAETGKAAAVAVPAGQPDSAPVVTRTPPAISAAPSVERPDLTPIALTAPAAETGKAAALVAAPIEQPDSAPVVTRMPPATPAAPSVERPELASIAVVAPVAEAGKAAPVAAPAGRPDSAPVVTRTPLAISAAPSVERPDLAPIELTTPVTETGKAASAAASAGRFDPAPVVARMPPAAPAAPSVERPDLAPTVLTAPVAETGKAAPVAASVGRPDSAPVAAKIPPAIPAVPPVEQAELAPTVLTAPVAETGKAAPVAAPVGRPDSAPVVAKIPPAIPAVPPVEQAELASMAVTTPMTETVSRLAATVAMATPVIDVAKKMINGQQDRTPIRLDAPSATLSSALSASTATGVTVAAVAGSDTAIQDAAAANRDAPQIIGGRPFQPRLADPFGAADPAVTVQTDPAMPALAGEAQPVSAPVITAGPNIARSDPSAAATIHDSPSNVAAAAQIRPQLVNGVVDAESPQLEKPSVEPVVIRAVEPTAPASGAALTPPASAASAAPSRPEAVTASAFAQTTPDTLDLQQSNWGRTLSHQLNGMINNRMQEAQIRVNPPDLGPIEVRMSLQQNQTNITFICHESAVREAIENALPRLREMLSSQGILLNQAQVSDQSLARQQPGFGEQPYNRREGGSAVVIPDQNPATDVDEQPLRPRRSLGMVDHYV